MGVLHSADHGWYRIHLETAQRQLVHKILIIIIMALHSLESSEISLANSTGIESFRNHSHQISFSCSTSVRVSSVSPVA